MSSLGSWGVSGPRFDSVSDWTSLANVKPAKNTLHRSSSSGSFSSPPGLSASPGLGSLPSPTNSRGMIGSPSVGSLPSPLGRGGLGSPAHGPITSPTQGTGRVPAFAFQSNPYQMPRATLAASIAHTLTSGGAPGGPGPNTGVGSSFSPISSPSLGPAASPHTFAIHQLPRARGHSAGTPSHAQGRSPIAIPLGAPLPLSPAALTTPSLPRARTSLVQAQTVLAQQRLQGNLSSEFAAAAGGPSAAYNPYLLTESASSPPSSNQLFRRTKNLEERLADYLKPPRVLPSATTPGAPGRHKRAHTVAEGRNISVNVVPHPKVPLGSLASPAGPAFKHRATLSPPRSSPPQTASSPTTPADEEFKEQADGIAERKGRKGDQTPPKKSKKQSNGHESEDETSMEDSFDGSASSTAPASMNLRAVLRAQKAQEAAAAEEKEKAKEARRPLGSLAWSDIIQARSHLLTQSKTKDAASGKAALQATAAHSAVALAVASNWLAQTKRSSSSDGPRKPFNVYSLSEYQRGEYKLAAEQAKWLTMFPKEAMNRKPAPGVPVSEPEPIPNDQKRVSSKTRCMNMAKGDIVLQSGSNTNATGDKTPSAAASLLYNTYVSCNGQYGYVRYMGRAPWGPGLWVGMELVEKHVHASFGAWVDFWHEHSAISMQMAEDTPAAAGGVQRRQSSLSGKAAAAAATTAAEQVAISNGSGSGSGPAAQMVVNTAVPRPMVLAAMLPPPKESKAFKMLQEKESKASAQDQYQPLANSIFPFIDVAAFLREGLSSCFEMQDLDQGLVYFAPAESVKRVAQRARIDSKALLMHKEHQTNPFADVDELACATPKKHEQTPEMLARYLTVSDREVLDGERNKARAIFRWICHNIRFDPQAATKGADVVSIIRYRKATAEGFAILFHALAQAGGLQVLRVRGVEKQLNHVTDQVVRSKHAWNAIKIEGEWSFIDCVFSCGQWTPQAEGSSKTPSLSGGTFQQMFSDAYFCTPPSLFILEHFPTDAFGDSFNKLLPGEYNNLQLLRSVVSATEFEKGLIPGRAFIEYHMRSSVTAFAIEAKQPSYQIELTAPSFILFDVELRIKNHVVDLSSASHVQYDGEQVTIFLIFPVPGEYVCKVTCKPSWRELEIWDPVLTYRITSHTGLVPLAANKDVIIGFMQHRKVNARDSRALFNRHFTLLHPLSGHLLPKAPFIVQVKGPDLADSVVVSCNGDWQRLSSSPMGGTGKMKMFEGTCIIQPRYELQVFYEVDRKFHLLYQYKANLTSMSNVYAEKTKTEMAAHHAQVASAGVQNPHLAPDLWHGKCSLGIEGRAFDANLSLDVPNCRFGRTVCTFLIHCSTAWDIALQVQEGWKNGTPLPEQQVIVDEIKSFRTGLMTQYKVTATLPATASLEHRPEPTVAIRSPQDRFRNAASEIAAATPQAPLDATKLAVGFVNTLSDSAARRVAEEAERKRAAANKIPMHSADVEDEPKASTRFTLVINARNIKQGGPMRYCLSYYFDVAKVGATNGKIELSRD